MVRKRRLTRVRRVAQKTVVLSKRRRLLRADCGPSARPDRNERENERKHLPAPDGVRHARNRAAKPSDILHLGAVRERVVRVGAAIRRGLAPSPAEAARLPHGEGRKMGATEEMRAEDASQQVTEVTEVTGAVIADRRLAEANAIGARDYRARARRAAAKTLAETIAVASSVASSVAAETIAAVRIRDRTAPKIGVAPKTAPKIAVAPQTAPKIAVASGTAPKIAVASQTALKIAVASAGPIAWMTIEGSVDNQRPHRGAIRHQSASSGNAVMSRKGTATPLILAHGTPGAPVQQLLRWRRGVLQQEKGEVPRHQLRVRDKRRQPFLRRRTMMSRWSRQPGQPEED